MSTNAWHEHCILRDDVRQGTLDLSEFAADLHAVRTGEAPDVYQIPNLFFERTYPTHNLKTLARSVLRRLAGQGGTPVITLQVAYGGGKTHSLITLLHLAENGIELQTHPTVQEFMAFSGLKSLPRTRVAILPFDEFDVKNGLVVVSPEGKKKSFKTPWGALAYQLAGDEGLAIVADHETDYINPAEQPLVDLLKLPHAEGLSTLILLDEALMYTRAAVNDDSKRFGILQDFFQALTQAVEKVSNASIVASLITSDIIADDPTGVRVLKMLEGVFRRLEETFEPVSRGDISELLRRRLFEHVLPETERRPIVDSLVAVRQSLPLRESDRDQEAYDELLKSYPFHPNFIDVFYQKWTQLEKFHGTRGMFRTFALILRDAAGTDPGTFVGPSALLATGTELSNALQELVKACDEGTQWTPILSGEFERARAIQKDLPLLKHREIETTVLSTFLHSQPERQKAELADLYLLLAHTGIDPMSVEKGLSEWREASWFLKENEKSWSLGTTSNLTNMHVRAMQRINEDQITEDLVKRIKDAKLGRNTDGVDVHTLPQGPSDISDTPELRFVIAGPEYAAVPGEEVRESLIAFFNRTYRNNVIVLAPENSLLIGLRLRIRRILGWQNIENSDDDMNQLIEPQKTRLLQRKQADETGMLESVISAYSVLIALDEDGNIKASALPPGMDSPFEQVKTALIAEDRLLTTSLDPDLLTPDSFFDIWGEDETAKPVQGLYGMFASLPRLPRLLNRQAFIDTLRRGVTEGKIVLRAVRPDGSQQTHWREASITDENIWKKESEIVPIEHAELHYLDPELLRPGQLPELWPDENIPITVSAIREFFSSDDVPKLESDNAFLEAIQSAVQNGLLMARSANKAYLKEHIPDAEMTDDMELLKPLEPISSSELSHNNLPDAWENETSSVGKIIHALALVKGSPIPWSLTVDAVNDGLEKKRFEFIEGSPPWPCLPAEADKIGLKVSQAPVTIDPNDLIGGDVESAWESGQPTLALIKETLEAKRGISISDDVFRYAVEQAIKIGIIASDDEPLTNGFYKIRVRKPAWMRHTDSQLTELEVQELTETVITLANIAPELDFKFRITITAEGEPPSSEVLEQINTALRKVTDKLKFE